MAEDQEDEPQQDKPDPNVYQPDQESDDLEIDRRIRRVHERLRRMTMVGFPQINETFGCQDTLTVEGGSDTGWAINYIDCGKQQAREGPPTPSGPCGIAPSGCQVLFRTQITISDADDCDGSLIFIDIFGDGPLFMWPDYPNSRLEVDWPDGSTSFITFVDIGGIAKRHDILVSFRTDLCACNDGEHNAVTLDLSVDGITVSNSTSLNLTAIDIFRVGSSSVGTGTAHRIIHCALAYSGLACVDPDPFSIFAQRFEFPGGDYTLFGDAILAGDEITIDSPNTSELVSAFTNNLTLLCCYYTIDVSVEATINWDCLPGCNMSGDGSGSTSIFLKSPCKTPDVTDQGIGVGISGTCTGTPVVCDGSWTGSIAMVTSLVSTGPKVTVRASINIPAPAECTCAGIVDSFSMNFPISTYSEPDGTYVTVLTGTGYTVTATAVWTRVSLACP